MINVELKEEKEVEEYKSFKMVTLKVEGNYTIVEFKDTHNSIVNAIRRTILDDVPTFAIEDVEIVRNESPLYDETIAHRLGLIPLKTDLSSYEFRKEGELGSALNEVKMTLSQDEQGYVYSGSIKSDDPAIVPVDTQIPVTKLFESKSIELNAKAILGTGREHAKWAPAHAYLRENKNSLELVIEPFGQLELKELYNKAIDILITKVEDLENIL